MYSDGNSKEEILNRMLGKVPNDLDRSEGSFLYDANSAISSELEESYKLLDDALEKAFAITSYGIFLDMRAAEIGVFRKQGTKARGEVTFIGQDGIKILQHIIVQTEGGLQFKTEKDIEIVNGIATVPIEAVKVGKEYNLPSETINQLPIQITGVTSVINKYPTEGGTDIEDDESLRKRLFYKVQLPATSGNIYHYKQWALEIPGVGDALVFPTWNGPGTVKVVIVDSNKARPSETIIKEVMENIENNKPIGAQVTVEGAIEKLINISARIELATSFNLSTVQNLFKKNVEEYFKSIAFKKSYLSYAQIGNLLINTDGVIDYSDLKVNGDVKNISFAQEEIAVAGSIELGV